VKGHPNFPSLFLFIMEQRMDYPCPAVQDAIDRIITESGFSDRARFLAWLRKEAGSPTYDPAGASSFHCEVATNSKDADLLLVTGHGRDFWML